MRSKQKKFPCFWCYSVPLGLYNASLGMLNMRRLSIVFDLDETLIVANTMKSFEDRIEALHSWIARELDPVRLSGMSAEMKRIMDDQELLKQYAEKNCVEDNGKMYEVQLEEACYLSSNQEKLLRPVIRLQEKNTILTRIDPEGLVYLIFKGLLIGESSNLKLQKRTFCHHPFTLEYFKKLLADAAQGSSSGLL